jgi:exodeoxyribonuclease-3
VRIATFNINNVNKRLTNLVEWLVRERPDIVCLQELKATDKQFPAGALAEIGYGAIWRGQALWNGVAILGKDTQPIATQRALPGQEDDGQARYIEAAVHGVIVGCLYAPNGNPLRTPKFAYKLAWLDSLLGHAKALFDSGHPVVLAGDYNVVPTDEDIYDTKSWRRNALLQPEARSRYQRLLEQGWIDTLRVHHGDARVYTFWDYFRDHWKRDAGLRLDHLLVAPALAETVRDTGVDKWVRGRPNASDHAPTWIVLEPPGQVRTKRRPRSARA